MAGKIASLTIDVVRYERADDVVASMARPVRQKDHGILRVVTDDGIEGNCIIGEFWEAADPLFLPILDVIKPALLGRDAADREWLWTQQKNWNRVFKATTKAWAPVDIALWDIAGKATGLPIYRLLGVQREKVPAYASYTTEFDEAAPYVTEAEDAVAKGFPAYKIHPGRLATDKAIRMVTDVRKAVGDDIDLMLDPNCGYDFQKALSIGRALDDQRFYWFEDPLPYHDQNAITELARRIDTPLSMSDQTPHQLFGTVPFVRSNAVRLPRGTALRLGITGLRKLCALSESFGLDCEIGVAGNAMLNAANLHVELSVANCGYHEYMMPQALEQVALAGYIEPDGNGNLRVPDAPGLGLTLDEEWIAAHKIATLD